ncbi:MAG: hypothetical protein NUV50_06830 [Rhodospirillales bacterium]|nr:hypothetical protein [Rhodospirillales bacterium]
MNTGVMGHRLFLDNMLHTAVALVLTAVALALSFGPIEWLLAYLGASVVLGPVLEYAVPHVRGELSPPERPLILPPSTNVGFSPPIWIGFAVLWSCLLVYTYLYPNEAVAVISNQHDALLARFSNPTNTGLIPIIAKTRLAYEQDGGVIQHFVVLALVVSCLMATYFTYFFSIFFGSEIRDSIRYLYFRKTIFGENIKNYFSLFKFLFGVYLVSSMLLYGVIIVDSAVYDLSMGFIFIYILYVGVFIFFFWFFPFVLVFVENYIRVIFFRKYCEKSKLSPN